MFDTFIVSEINIILECEKYFLLIFGIVYENEKADLLLKMIHIK